MRFAFLIIGCIGLLFAANDWATWRGPNHDGMARGDAPVEWSDTKNIAWKVNIPGRGHSSPVLWGNKLFLTTAVPSPGAASSLQQPQGRGAGGGTAAGQEHKFMVLCLDRQTGKTIWERVAATATPHEGYHNRYG